MSKKSKKFSTSKTGKKLWYAFMASGLAARGLAAIALIVIAAMLCSVKKESKVFNQCVEEVRNNGKSISNAVSFCNGGGV